MKKLLLVLTLIASVQFSDSDKVKTIAPTCDGSNCNLARNFNDC